MSMTSRSGNWLCTPMAEWCRAHRAQAAARENARAMNLQTERATSVLADAHRDHGVAVMRELPKLVDGVLLQDAGE